jgi:hypothetical protein
VSITGANFQQGADAELLLSDEPTYEQAVASRPQIVRPLRAPDVSGTTSAFAEFRIHHSLARAMPPNADALKKMAEKDKAYADALTARQAARTKRDKAREDYEKAPAADQNAKEQAVYEAEQAFREARANVAAALRDKEQATREAILQRLEFGRAFVRLINPDGQFGIGPLEIPPLPTSELEIEAVMGTQD